MSDFMLTLSHNQFFMNTTLYVVFTILSLFFFWLRIFSTYNCYERTDYIINLVLVAGMYAFIIGFLKHSDSFHTNLWVKCMYISGLIISVLAIINFVVSIIYKKQFTVQSLFNRQ